jgi:hypothetical protein
MLISHASSQVEKRQHISFAPARRNQGLGGARALFHSRERLSLQFAARDDKSGDEDREQRCHDDAHCQRKTRGQRARAVENATHRCE